MGGGAQFRHCCTLGVYVLCAWKEWGGGGAQTDFIELPQIIKQGTFITQIFLDCILYDTILWTTLYSARQDARLAAQEARSGFVKQPSTRLLSV
jgi:hypothetical protein